MNEAGFAKKLAGYAQAIGYAPMSDEPVYADFLKQFNVTLHEEIIPADATIDPLTAGGDFLKRHEGRSTVIFVPGQKFDATGTRHGRGHGWYDRFLSAVPREWLRVGILYGTQLSQEPLVRQTWDQPMDALLVCEDGSWRVISV